MKKTMDFNKMKAKGRRRTVALVAFDVVAIQLSMFLALWIRFDFKLGVLMTGKYLHTALQYAPINTILTITVFLLFNMYENIWSYVGFREGFSGCAACLVSSVLQTVAMFFLDLRLPRSFHVFYPFLLIVFTVGIRFSYRLVHYLEVRKVPKNVENVMIVGAGEAGAVLLKEYQNSKYLNKHVACLIDDNPAKLHKYLHGCKIVGNRDTIVKNAKKYEISEISISIPSLNNTQKKELLQICQETGCKVKILPGLYQLVNEEVTISNLRSVEIEDLLGRDPIKVNTEEIIGYVSNKVVLVTGGGGSIGSELCRQIVLHHPKQLIIVDIYENNAYEIQQELKRNYPKLDLVVLIASVRNTIRMNWIFEHYRPEIVYHAAAHKHVPLMEDSPHEAIKNNVFGTYKTAMAAGTYGARRFVLISTDKAVNPTNIMGASKRLCEMIVQTMNKKYDTEFVAVRFGNVLGSNGSVIPLFRKQIMAGGPVTVTHPDIIRYFMTIPEAVSLVLQAGAYAKGGEIFIFDMGEPVKIADLARNMIRLSGFAPDEDIQIVYTGLRPGEKLYEELLMEEEGMQDTANHLIHIGKPIEMNEEQFLIDLEELRSMADTDSLGIRQKVKDMVPTYVIQVSD